MTRILYVVLSAVIGAGLVVTLLQTGGLPFAESASTLGVSAPMIGVALAFPAIYLLWEQSEL